MKMKMTTTITLSSPSSSFFAPAIPKPLKNPNFPSPKRAPNPLSIKSNLSPSPSPSPEPDPVPPAVRTFWKWLTHEGVITPKSPFKPAMFREGLGLGAVRDIGEDEVFMKVPRRLWINSDTVSGSEIGIVCSELEHWVSVSLFLAREKLRGDQSKWRFYIDTLPKHTDSTLFWSEEELSQIQGTQLLKTTIEEKKELEDVFRKVEKEIIMPNKAQLFPHPLTVTLDDFLWAVGMVRSRAFARHKSQNPVVVPLVDLLNHSSTVSKEQCATEIEGAASLFSWDLLFVLQAPIPFKAGHQIFIQYNLKKSNTQMAFDYGFIEPTTPSRNTYVLTLEIPESDPFFEDKLSIANSNGLGQTASFDIILGQPLPPPVVPYLRLVALSGPDAFLMEPLYRSSIWDLLGSPISRANEQLVCQIARNACKSALSGYHTTIDEDEKLLKEDGNNLEPRLGIAVRIRAIEKKVVQQIDGFFEERELKLHELEYYQERRFKELGFVGKHGEVVLCEPKCIEQIV